MAELNFGLLTPPGSQSIGNAFVTGMDQAAAARAQENQNALSQYTLSKAKREDELTNQLLGDLRGATTNEEIVKAYLRAGKPDVASKLQSDALARQKLGLEIAGMPGQTAKTLAETKKLENENRFKVIGEIASFPDAASANQAIDARLASKAITQEHADEMRQGLTDENFTNWKRKTLTHILSPAEQLRQSAVTHVDTNRGGFVGRQYFDAQGQAVGPEERLDITVSPNTTATIEATRKNHLETLGVNRAGLAIRAVGADPFNLSGLQDQYPPAGAGAAPRSNNLGTVPPVATPTAAPATPTGPTLGGSKLSLKDGIAQGLTGDALLATMPRNLAAQVTAITDHRAASPGRNTVRGDSLMQLVNMVDPTYDATQFKTKQGIETAFTSGRLGNTLRSLNVVQDHLDVFKDTAKALGNDNIQFTNAMGNQIARWTGEPAPTDFAAVRNVVADELTKAILGTAGALGDRTEMRNEVSAAASPKQLAGVVGKWQKLITGQVKGLQDQYTSGGGTNAAVKTLFTRAAAASAPTTASGGGAPTGTWGTAVAK